MTTTDPRIERLFVHDDFVRALARRLIRQRDAAEDLAQDAWTEVLAKPPSNVLAPRRWLAVIVRNLASKRRRADDHRRSRESSAARSEALPSAAEILERESVRARLVTAVLRLDEPYRSTILLRYFEDLPPRTIAHRQGVPVETVRTRLQRAHALLRGDLDREYGDRSAWCALLLPWSLGPAPLPLTRLVPDELRRIFSPLPRTAIMKLALGILAVSTGSLFLWQALRSEPGARAATSSAAGTPAVSSLEPGAGQELRPAATNVPRDAVAPATAGTSATAGGTVLVKATWSDGAPAAGVAVRAEATSHAGPGYFFEEATTDDHGECALAVGTGGVSVWADRVKYPTRVQVEPGEEERVEFALEPGFDVQGVVVDAEGSPVAGADVLLSPAPGLSPGAISMVVAHSAVDGTFAIRECRSRAYLGARASGHAPALMQLLLADQGTTLTTRLVLRGEGGAIEGMVTNPSGHFVAGAVVVAGGPGEDYGSVQRFGSSVGVLPDAYLTHTDEKGRFRIEGLEAGLVPIGVRAAGFAISTGETEVFAARTARVDIALTLGVTLTGNVVDLDGKPISGADVDVDVDEAYGPLGSWTRSAADGSFRFADLEPGTIAVSAEDDCATQSASIRLQGAPGAELSWQAVLSPHASIVGRVVDENGAPLADWYIDVSDEAVSEEGYLDYTIAETDEQGRFEAPDLRVRPHSLEVRAEDSLFPSAIVQHVTPGEGELVVVVETSRLPSIHIVGSIHDEEGRPAIGVQIRPELSSYTSAPVTTIAGDGSFELGPYPAGTWTLVLQAQGLPELRLGPQELAVGATWDLGELVLGPEGFDR